MLVSKFLTIVMWPAADTLSDADKLAVHGTGTVFDLLPTLVGYEENHLDLQGLHNLNMRVPNF